MHFHVHLETMAVTLSGCLQRNNSSSWDEHGNCSSWSSWNERTTAKYSTQFFAMNGPTLSTHSVLGMNGPTQF